MKYLFLILFSASAMACNDADFVANHNASVTVALAGMAYTPKCLKVVKGTVVTLPAGNFHPLQGVQLAGVTNPFVSPVPAPSPQTRTLAEAGEFPYFCVSHGNANGGGMAGVIRVVDAL